MVELQAQPMVFCYSLNGVRSSSVADFGIASAICRGTGLLVLRSRLRSLTFEGVLGWHRVKTYCLSQSYLSFTLTACITGRDNCRVWKARLHSPCGLAQPMNTFPS
jgi:hypothetical protein